MHAQGHSSILITVLILALVAWRMYARSRRLIGRQRLSKWRPWVTVTLFPLFLVILTVLSRHQPPALWALAGGAFAGIGLGILGLKLTKFETTPTGACYTPSAHLGMALSTLLVLRIGYPSSRPRSRQTSVRHPPATRARR
jgi:hypothetical protein